MNVSYRTNSNTQEVTCYCTCTGWLIETDLLCGVWQNVISIVQVYLLQRPCDMALFRFELALGQSWVAKIANHCADPWGEAHGSQLHPVLTLWRPGCQLVYRLQRGLSFLWFSVLCAVGLGAAWVYYHCKIKQEQAGSSQLTAVLRVIRGNFIKYIL